jgi:hypothetical protein
MRGALGADVEHQAAIERLRWLGAQRILLALVIVEPIPAPLRTAMHGWVGYLDEMMIDRITHRDVDAEALVEWPPLPWLPRCAPRPRSMSRSPSQTR